MAMCSRLYSVHAERDELACAKDSWVSVKISDAIYCKLEEVVMDLDDDIAVLYEAKPYIVHCYTYI